MSYQVKEIFNNISDISYSSLEEYKDWFSDKRNEFINTLKLNDPDIYDSDIINALDLKIISEEFNVADQYYTRIVDWGNVNMWISYASLIETIDWTVEPYLSLSDANLGIKKFTEIL